MIIWFPSGTQVKSLIKGGAKIFDLVTPEKRNILVLDDPITIASLNKSVADLFTNGSDHRKLTVIYLAQNVYNQGKSKRSISLNSLYSLVSLNVRDTSQFRTMAYNICPSNVQLLADSLTNATSKLYGYLVFWTTTHRQLYTKQSWLICFL